MSINDHSIIDRALDSAQERIDDAASPDPVEVPVKEETKEAPEVEEVEQPLAAEADEKISGKEANEGEDKASEETVEAAKPAESEVEPIEIPAFLPAETKALLAEANPALRQKIVAAYNQQEQTTRRALSESGQLKAEKARVDEVFAPHRTRLQAQGVKDIADLASRALAWDELITKDPKAFVIAQMKQNGITPQDLMQEDAGYDPGQQVNDPRVDEALEAAKQAKEQFESFQLEQQRTVLTQELESFKQGKDSSGVTRKAFVEMFEPQIAETIKLIKSDPQYNHLSRQDVMHHAYEYVVSNARASGFQFVTPAQKAAPLTNEQVIANANKQKAAASSVKGAPASGTSKPRPRLKGDSFEEKLNSAMDIAESRSSTGR